MRLGEGVAASYKKAKKPMVPSLKKPFHTMLKIAITGGAGSGKSTVARMFKELGAEVLDADQIARDAVAIGTPAWQELRCVYGEDFFHQNGSLNRSKLAEKVFADPEARRALNALIHPLVAQELQRQVADLERRGVDLVLVSYDPRQVYRAIHGASQALQRGKIGRPRLQESAWRLDDFNRRVPPPSTTGRSAKLIETGPIRVQEVPAEA